MMNFSRADGLLGKVKTHETRDIIVDDTDVRSDELLKSRWSVQKVETNETKKKSSGR